MPDNIRKMVIDGITLPVTDEAETFIKKLQADVAKLTTDNLALQAAHRTEVAAKDAEIATRDRTLGEKDGEIAKLKDAAPTPAALAGLVAEIADVTGKARMIAADGDYNSKAIEEIRRVAVAKKLGDAAVAGKSDDFVWGLFEKLVSDAPSPGRDPVAAAFRTADTASSGDLMKQRADAHAAYRQSLADAWKQPAQKQGVH